MHPKISVVIPTYQCATYVRQAVESVIAQRYPKECVEVIIIDDGSTDDTFDVLKPYAKQIRYIHQSNRGLSAARNVGINAAQTDLIALLDADDYWLPDFLSDASDLMGREGEHLVTCDWFESVNEELAEVPFYRKRHLERVFERSATAQLNVGLEANILVASMMMVHRAVFSDVGLFDETLHFCEDLDFFYRCMSANYRVALVPRPNGVYRRFRPGGLTARIDLEKARDRVRVLSRYRNRLSKRRWYNAVGVMDDVGFREALIKGSYGAAARHAVSLLFNPLYTRAVLSRAGNRLAGLVKKAQNTR